MLPPIRPRLPFVGIALSVMAGIAVADRWALPFSALVVAAVGFGLASWLTRKATICLLFAALAFAAMHTANFRLHPGRDLERSLEPGPRVATVEGMVNSEPEPLPYWSRKQTGTFRLQTASMEIAGVRWSLESGLVVTWAGPLPRYGDRVKIRGSLQAVGPPRNPGQFDYAGYLRRQGVSAKLEAEMPQDCVVEARDTGNPLVAMSIVSRRWMQAQLALDLDDSPEYAALISSMVLGLRGETPDEIKDLFRRTGTLHLFAVSGLNVGMLGYIAWLVLKPLGIGRRAAVFIIIPVLAFYALITGLSPSCVRAAVMAALVLFGEFLDRRTSVYNSLAAAAVVILAWDSNQLFATGFQFSFVLVFVIVLCAQRMERRMERVALPDEFLPKILWTRAQQIQARTARIVAGSIAVTVSAWLGSLAFTAGYFHLFSLSSIVANLVAVPIAFIVLALGLLTLLAAPLVKGLAIIFNNANWLCAKLLLSSVDFFAAIPGGHSYVEINLLKSEPSAEFTVLDLNEGAAIHLRGGDTDWLVDAGTAWRYPNVTLPYLRSRGVDRLDTVLLTHGDAQHIGGALMVIADFEPRLVLDSPLKDRSTTRRKLYTALAARKRGKAVTQRGDQWTCGTASIRVLYPESGLRRSLADDKALVLTFECEGVRALFMSDSGIATEQWLMENEPDLRADILVKGHHSKDFSGTTDFLARVQPQVIIVGALRYGLQPTDLDPWVQEATALGASVFRQDQCGAVTCEIKPGGFELRSYLPGQTFRSRARLPTSR